MSENRGFWLALGGVLLSVGFTGLIAYCIAIVVAMPPQPFLWRAPASIACDVTVVVGGAILIAVQLSIKMALARVRSVSMFLAEGNALFESVRAQRDNTQAAEFKRRAEEWVNKVHRWLVEELPEYDPVFLSETGYGATFFESTRHEISNIQRWIERKLQILEQIHLRIS
jgi:hypothetical protein